MKNNLVVKNEISFYQTEFYAFLFKCCKYQTDEDISGPKHVAVIRSATI